MTTVIYRDANVNYAAYLNELGPNHTLIEKAINNENGTIPWVSKVMTLLLELNLANCLIYGYPQEKRGYLVHSDVVRTGEHPLVTAIFKPMLRGTFPQPIKYYWAYCASIFEDEDFVKQVIFWKHHHQ